MCSTRSHHLCGLLCRFTEERSAFEEVIGRALCVFGEKLAGKICVAGERGFDDSMRDVDKEHGDIVQPE